MVNVGACNYQHWSGCISGFHELTDLASLNTLRPRQNGHLFPHDIFKCIFLNENVWILINISLKFVPKGPINNIPALVQIMAWRRPGDKPLSEPMLLVRLLTDICVTRPQWVNPTHGWHFIHGSLNVEFNKVYFEGLVQDCSNSSALALGLLQSCTKPLICRCPVDDQCHWKGNKPWPKALITNITASLGDSGLKPDLLYE